jgi:hypothetical protein
MIADVITRVKCEIADAFDELRPDRRFDWLRDWTAKADLTLQINTQAGIAPSGSYTKFQRNAFNFDAGSTSLTNNTIASVSQFFALTASANVGEQAVRTETVSFSLALDELHEWREYMRAIESAPDFPLEHRVCDYGNANELRGNLGLREWVASAFYPVHRQELWAGDHPAPGTAKATTPPSAVPLPKPQSTAAAAFGPTDQPTPDQVKNITDAYSHVKDALQQAVLNANDVTLTRKVIEDALKAATKQRNAFTPVAIPKAIASASQVVETLQLAYNYAKIDEAGAKKAVEDPQEGVRSILKDAQTRYDRFIENQKENKKNGTKADYQTDVDQTMIDDTKSKAGAENAKRFSDHAQALQKTAALVSYTPDPPIDSILHSVQFVVSYGGSITPSWTLINWKGPGLNAPAASAQGVRTNILNLALGPRSGATKSTPEQTRLINNAILLLTRPSQ